MWIIPGGERLDYHPNPKSRWEWSLQPSQIQALQRAQQTAQTAGPTSNESLIIQHKNISQGKSLWHEGLSKDIPIFCDPNVLGSHNPKPAQGATLNPWDFRVEFHMCTNEESRPELLRAAQIQGIQLRNQSMDQGSGTRSSKF